MRSRSTARRRFRTSPCSACSPRKASARTCPRSASSSWRCAAGVARRRIVVHGNNKSDEELRRAAEADAWLVVLDAATTPSGQRLRGVRRVLVRVTPGIDPTRTTRSRRATAARSSACRPSRRCALIARAASSGWTCQGSTSTSARSSSTSRRRASSVDWLAGFARRVPLRARLDAGRRRRRRRPRHPLRRRGHGAVDPRLRARRSSSASSTRGRCTRCRKPRLVLEPGRSLVGEAGVTLYRVGVVKKRERDVTYVAVDGGMSDNPRPQLYEARFTCLLANRADEAADGRVHGLRQALRVGRRARSSARRCPSRAAATSSPFPPPARTRWRWRRTTTRVPRPAAVLVADGRARLIRRRETIDDLLALEAGRGR